jgi:hypothetical protein
MMISCPVTKIWYKIDFWVMAAVLRQFYTINIVISSFYVFHHLKHPQKHIFRHYFHSDIMSGYKVMTNNRFFGNGRRFLPFSRLATRCRDGTVLYFAVGTPGNIMRHSSACGFFARGISKNKALFGPYFLQ